MPGGCSRSPNLFSSGRAAGRSMGSSLWAPRGPVLHDAREEATSLGRPNFKHWVLEENISFGKGTTAQGNLGFKSGTCLSDFPDLGPDPKIGSDKQKFPHPSITRPQAASERET